jgi:pantoate--beta-alanine ligase
MKTATGIAAMRACLAELADGGARIALVPTMGALHEGHLALVDAAHEAADAVVVSVFVNPLQFGQGEDLGRYPRTIGSDAAKLAERGAAILFAPSANEMYPSGPGTTVTPPPFADLLEGAMRPGHFSGVLTVVAKLFHIVRPNVAIFGRKDLQQLAVIRAMVTDLNFPVEVRAVETIRERDGLALSSRNRYLDDQSRRRATRLHASLGAAKNAFDSGAAAPSDIEAAALSVLAQDGAIDVDYVTVIREADFVRPSTASIGDSVVAAVRIGGTRLIDNIQL